MFNIEKIKEKFTNDLEYTEEVVNYISANYEVFNNLVAYINDEDFFHGFAYKVINALKEPSKNKYNSELPYVCFTDDGYLVSHTKESYDQLLFDNINNILDYVMSGDIKYQLELFILGNEEKFNVQGEDEWE